VPVRAGARGVRALALDLDLAAARDKRVNARNDIFKDRRPEFYGPVSSARPRSRG